MFSFGSAETEGAGATEIVGSGVVAAAGADGFVRRDVGGPVRVRIELSTGVPWGDKGSELRDEDSCFAGGSDDS